MNCFNLFDIGGDVKLFYDSNSMGIFPLDINEDKEIISYLESLKETPNLTIRDEEIEQWLNMCISEIPNSPEINNEDLSNPSPRALVLPIASSCNLKCPYCFAQTNQGTFNFTDYSQEDIDKLLIQLKEYAKVEPVTLIFFGGEPLVKFDIIQYTVNQIKEHYKDCKYSFSITTNGTLLNKERVLFLRDNNFAVLVSMDGYDNDYNHRHFRNGKSSVARVLRNIDILKDLRVPFEIRATLTSDNPYIYQTWQFFEQLQVPFAIVFAYPSENTSNSDLNTFSNDVCMSRIRTDFQNLLEYYAQKIKNSEPIYDTTFKTISDIIEHRTHRKRICAAGNSYFTVMSNGNIYACAHLMNNPEYIIGKGFNFEKMNIDSPSIPANIEQIEDCRDCWAKNLCMGGCTSQKLSLGKKTNESFPRAQCDLQLLLYEHYIRLYYILKTQNPNERINDQ